MVAATRKIQHKRHGKHQRRTKDFHTVYWPYIPLVLIVSLGIVFSAAWQPRQSRGVLSYATSVSVSGLLQATNQQRNSHGISSLGLSSKLDNAAQAKANDMVKRNYWSHNTPDGNPPWVFISNAGYAYTTAGENLAYGFTTSTDTINGWMNSPPHKENLLNSGFTEVGFGYANSSNYVGSGQETVVVAMYAKPATVVATTPVSSSGTTKSAETTAPTQSANKPAAPKPTSKPKPKVVVKKSEQPVTTFSTSSTEPQTRSVSRMAALTYTSMPWLASLTSILLVGAIGAYAFRHAFAINRWIKRGEKYMLHHVVYDITFIAFIGLLIIVNHTAGFIK